MREPKLVKLHRELHRIARLRRNAATDCYAFQCEALSLIIRYENRIRHERDVIAVQRQRLTSTDGVRLSREEATVAKRRIEHSNAMIAEHRWGADIVRSLCDGLAFAFLPKYDIKPLALKEPPGFISGKTGLRLERKILRAVALRARRVAILNDLTNCLRYGDITISGEPPILFEVKSGKVRSTRDERQKRKAEEVMNYLRRDFAEGWRGTAVTVRRTELHIPERHHWRVIPTLIRQAYAAGIATCRPEKGMWYAALSGAGAASAIADLLGKFSEPPLVFALFKNMVP
jgi:hypothetical protein